MKPQARQMGRFLGNDMKITIVIEENTQRLEHQGWPWNVRLNYEPGRRCTSTYAWSLQDAFAKLENLVKEDL